MLSPLVVVRDFDVERITVSPSEADPPPVVDANRVLAHSITLEDFESEAWTFEVAQGPCTVQEDELP